MATQQPIIIKSDSGNSGLILKAATGALGLIALAYGVKKVRDYVQNKAQESAPTDINANIASQFYAELQKTNPNDTLLIELAKQIVDYKAVSDKYKDISRGGSLINDITNKNFVGTDTLQAILRVLAEKSGAKQATSPQVVALQASTKSTAPVWIVAQTDIRIRKNPFAHSFAKAVIDTTTSIYKLKNQNNILATAKPGDVVGFLDKKAFELAGKKPIYDAVNNAYFIPIKIFVGNYITTQSAFVAASGISPQVAAKSPKTPLLISQKNFDNAQVILNGVATPTTAQLLM